jgi:hypothetical protein
MRPLSASDLLNVWEQGTGRTPVEQALALLNMVFPQLSEGILARLDIVQRDRCLLYLHELTFGSRLKGQADCPACPERLELEFELKDLYESMLPLPDPEITAALNPETSFSTNGYELIYRLPNSMDLITLSEATNAGSRRQQILEACILSAQYNQKTIVVDELPSEVLNALVEHMNDTNPLANLTFAVTCPACGHAWDIIFDVVSFFWSEIHAWSLRLLREVHTLAAAYSWHEADILSMSAWRRQKYLELIGA